MLSRVKTFLDFKAHYLTLDVEVRNVELVLKVHYDNLGVRMKQVEEVFGELKVAIGALDQSQLGEATEVTGLSQRRVTEIWREMNHVEKLTWEAVLGVIQLLKEAEVTAYKEIAQALGKPSGAQAVGNIIKLREISAREAAKVIPTRKTRGAFYVMDNTEFDSHEEPHLTRASAMDLAGIPHQLIGNEVLVPFSAFVDHTTLQQRAGR